MRTALESRRASTEYPEGPVANIDPGAGLLDDMAEQDGAEMSASIIRMVSMSCRSSTGFVDLPVGHRLSVAMVRMV